MNKARRAEIDRAVALLAEVKEKLAEAQQIVQTCAEEEQEYVDNMPESLQQGEKGQRAQEVASDLDSVASDLDIDLDDFVSQLEAAKE